MLDLIGFGMVIPLLPLYAQRFDASPIQIGFLTAVYTLMQLAFAPLWGRLSDRIGRRPVIMASLAGSAAASLVFGLAGTLWLLFVARAVDGISGASYAAAQAYIADVTSPEERAHGMGLIGAAFGIGFVVGPGLGALLALGDPRLPFLTAAALAAANLGLAYVRLPESRRPGTRGERRPGFGQLVRALARPELSPLVWVTFVGTFAFVGMETTFALYGHERFGFTLAEAGAVFAYIGVVAAVVQGGLVGRLVRRHGERPVLLAGLVLTGAALAAIPAARTLWQLLVIMGVVAAASGLVFPTVTAIFSRRAGADAQGGMLGLLASTGSLARLVGPVVGTVLFERVGTSWPYLLGGALFAVCAVIAARTMFPRSVLA
ncbi:MAG: transporter, family, tetracycline resistance protein [Miltoncostaeaceae bacterium]|nr:transporter, family, tetracycline resistance protein [Miltoncostaeaceae bacterium]